MGNQLKDYVRESIQFSIEIKDDTSTQEINELIGQLKQEDFVKNVRYISKEDAMEELTEELGESPKEFLGWNPLSATLEVQVKSEYAASDESIQKVEASIQKYKPLEKLSYKRDLLENINKNIRTISIAVIGFAVILLFISFFLVNNTIRLLIYSRRFSIYTMKLVGATPGFIRRPFVSYNLVSSIISAIIAVIALTALWFFLQKEYTFIHSALSIQNALIVVALVFCFGLFIAILSSYFSVNKYLRMNLNKLYRA